MPLITTCVMGSAYSRHSQGCINYSGTAAGFGNEAVQCCSCSPLCKLPLVLRRWSWYSVIVLQLLDRLQQIHLPTVANTCPHNSVSVHTPHSSQSRQISRIVTWVVRFFLSLFHIYEFIHSYSVTFSCWSGLWWIQCLSQEHHTPEHIRRESITEHRADIFT